VTAWRQMMGAFLLAILLSAIVLGSISLSLVENGLQLALAPTLPYTITPYDFPAITPEFALAGSLTPAAALATETALPSPTFTPSVNCPPPEGWDAVMIMPEDTLQTLADAYNTSVEELSKANCLVVDTLLPGTVLRVPKHPQPTLTPTLACGAPAGWVQYMVRNGDTLFNLGARLRVGVAQLQKANCLVEVFIYTGQVLFVPFIPAPLYNTPYPTPYPYPTWTPYWPTFTPYWPTSTPWAPPTWTPVPYDTPTLPPVYTSTPEPPPVDTNTPIPSAQPPTLEPPTKEPPTLEPPTQEPPTQEPPTLPPPPPSQPPPTQPIPTTYP
jgi:LysM repeat protein